MAGQDALVRCSDGRSFLVGDLLYHDDNRANASLIAAAPDLLAVAKGMHEAERREYGIILSCVNGAAPCRACAAIAKAEGR